MPFRIIASYTCLMRDDVRFANETTVEDDIHASQLPASFKSLADEVKARSSKTKTTPLSIPQKLSLAEFNTAMVHFYRGEVQRSNVWRGRLDATTNWAVITAGAMLSFVFSSPNYPHFAIPFYLFLIMFFL